MLEESETSTQAQHEIRAQRESELASLKKSLEDERADHESVVASMRQKHSRAVGELNDQIDSLKKVGRSTAVVLRVCTLSVLFQFSFYNVILAL